jgi:hypothetical protein
VDEAGGDRRDPAAAARRDQSEERQPEAGCGGHGLQRAPRGASTLALRRGNQAVCAPQQFPTPFPRLVLLWRIIHPSAHEIFRSETFHPETGGRACRDELPRA